MKQIFSIFILIPFLFVGLSFQPNKEIELKKAFQNEKLFDSDEILNIKISGNLRTLLNDRYDTPKYQALTFSYKKNDSSEVSFPIQIKTRGRFRRLVENCTYPPLLLNFAKKEQPKESIFYKQDKVKLVMPCKGDEYVIREWLLYKIYNLITPESFKARLVKVELDDTQKKKNVAAFYGILLEEELQLGKRNNMNSIAQNNFKPELTDEAAFIRMAVFQYFIGNTDWSVQYQQNVKLFLKDTLSKFPVTVPYDFDHAGLVEAHYAQPFEELEMKSVRERRYRGYCINDMKKFEEVISLFNKLKPDIYKLYENCNFLDAKYKKDSFKYFDEFYKTINDPEKLKFAFTYPCDPKGTGDVIIRGLK